MKLPFLGVFALIPLFLFLPGATCDSVKVTPKTVVDAVTAACVVANEALTVPELAKVCNIEEGIAGSLKTLLGEKEVKDRRMLACPAPVDAGK